RIISEKNGYRIEEFTTSGSTVREYIAKSNGLVFGIAWEGRINPPLDKLLGSYKAEYQKAESSPQPENNRRRVRTRAGRALVRTDKLVVERGGHMRALHGKAYLPAMLPSGVTA